jgi:recombination protein RecA
MSLIAIAQAQKAGGRAAFIDVEHAFSVEYAQSMGIDTDKLYFVQPDFGEQALEILERLTATNEYDIIVLDSTAALLPKAEMEEEVGKQFMALQARMMSQALRKLTPVVGKTKTVVIFINQTRQNVGVMYGNPTTTPGGEALKFYSSVRLNVRRTGGSDIKDGKDILGHRINITCVKNKVAPPLKSAELTFVYGKGIDTVLDMLEYATDKGILTVTGHTYSLGTNKWVGRDNAIKAIQEDPALTKQVEELLLAAATSPKA